MLIKVADFLYINGNVAFDLGSRKLVTVNTGVPSALGSLAGSAVSEVQTLIDGLSSLPEKETDVKGIETYIVGKRVNLDEARFWTLDPADPLASPPNRL